MNLWNKASPCYTFHQELITSGDKLFIWFGATLVNDIYYLLKTIYFISTDGYE